MNSQTADMTVCWKTGKVCYSYREAHFQLNSWKRRRGKGRRKHIPKRAYRCEWCGLYHLTHLNHYGRI